MLINPNTFMTITPLEAFALQMMGDDIESVRTHEILSFSEAQLGKSCF